MKILRKLLLILGALATLGVTLILVGALVVRIQASRRVARDTPFAEEGHRSAEAFLRASSVEVLRSLGVTNDPGSFLRLEGSGFGYPVWNIQGYDFLSLGRTAAFGNGSQSVRVIVTSGPHRKGGRFAGTCSVRDGMIFVHVRDED